MCERASVPGSQTKCHQQRKLCAYSNRHKNLLLLLAHVHTTVTDSEFAIFSLSLQICFLVSAFRGRMFSEDSCAALALFSHYFHLSQFFWMLIQVTAD